MELDPKHENVPTVLIGQLSSELRPHKAMTVGDTPARDACRARTRILGDILSILENNNF